MANVLARDVDTLAGRVGELGLSDLTAPVAPSPRSPHLLVATAVAVAAHAALLLGLPRWFTPSATRADLDAGAFNTRVVALSGPAPAPAATVAPALVTAPPAPSVRPVPRRRPAAKTPSVAPPPPEAAPDRSAAAPPAEPARPHSTGTDPSASLLGPPPLVGFGGSSAPAPIQPPLPTDAAATALQWAERGQPGVALSLPPSARLTYRTTGTVGSEPLDLRTTFHWRQDGQAYEGRWPLYSPRAGDHSRSNTGLVTAQGLLPVRAVWQPPSGLVVRFDYGDERVRFADSEMPLTHGMQDRLGVLVQLGALLAADPKRLQAGTLIELPAAHDRGAGRWHFKVLGEEMLAAMGRDLPVVHLLHEALGDGDPRVEVWLGRQLEYLPVRLRITEPNGDVFEHLLQTAYTEAVPSVTPR